MRYRRNLVTIVAVLVTLVLVAITARTTEAGSVATNMSVSATVDSSCQIATTNLSFADYSPLGANATIPDDATATVTITCTLGTSGQILIGHGTNWTGSQMRMLNAVASTYLPYTVYQDNAHTVVWDGITGMTIPPAPDTTPRTYTAYGRVPAGQTVASGAYSDTVSISISF